MDKTKYSLSDLLKLAKVLREKGLTLKHIDVKSNTISLWEEKGLLDKYEPTQDRRAWRCYSLLDLLWIDLLKELRHFGLNTSQLLGMKAYIYDTSEKQVYVKTLLEEWVITILGGDSSLCLSINKEGETFVHKVRDWGKTIQQGSVENHVYINLNAMIEECYKNHELRLPDGRLVPVNCTGVQGRNKKDQKG